MSYGCFYLQDADGQFVRNSLPQIGLDAHANIITTNSRTIFTQTFVNPSSTESISEVSYSFPLYESSSIVGFTCHIGDNVIEGTVKTKAKANEIYGEAKSQGKSAAVLDRSVSAADVFSTRLGNIPAAGFVIIEITLIGELSQDSQTDGIRYTIPSLIAPRYESQSASQDPPEGCLLRTSIVVDVLMEKGSHVRNIRSPGHPIQVELGRVSTMEESTFQSCLASVKLQENVVLHEDFVITVNADKQDLPFALLETHPTLPDQKALMVSLVPKFSLPPDSSEIVFVVDRSGSMADKISALRSSLELFLRSFPLGVPFNIISFGSRHEALWSRSKTSNNESLGEALKYTKSFKANMGGTEIQEGLQTAVKNRYLDKFLEVLVLTDGAVRNQSQIFDLVNQANQNHSARFFTLGLGNSVSHSLVNGISRAGKGFSQTVLKNEDMNKTVVRMLKGALMPRLLDSRLDMNIPNLEEDFVQFELPESDKKETEATSKLISLFDQSHDDEKEIGDLSEPLPEINIPRILQAPADLAGLFPFVRSNIYLLLSHASETFPETITLRANSKHGPLELEIPVQDIGKGQTIHQLAAKKIVTEVEESHGWIYSAKDTQGKLITNKWESRVNELNQRECERLGVKFQVAGKHCSFVAIQDESPLDLSNHRYVGLRGLRGLQADRRMVDHGDFKNTKIDCAIKMNKTRRVPSFGFASRVMAKVRDVRSLFASASFASAESVLSGPPYGGPSPAYAPSSPAYLPTSPAYSPANPQPDLGSDDKEEDAGSVEYKLFSLQSFEGYWEMSDHLLQTMGLDPVSTRDKIHSDYEELKGAEAGEVSRLEVWHSLLATSLVCLFLEHEKSESKEVWELVKAKADGWVQIEVDALSPADRRVVTKVIDGLASFFGTS
ncbi:von Willebrand factor type A [Penicillium antarcticum]|uniref:von Willebrand factor type A n=1 Tax=Penicillium antarcticum TaxID=416450 RepID=UPI0023A52A43|nr:von Willebrand factor type A [Penicillium antarcticum]KAJ5311881.1 von Willebrand factor type A [Penicillium antarcticum]